MENKVCLFKETPITFIIDKNNNMMINATEMAKPYGKKVNEFMSNSTTTEFINEALKSGNSRFLNVFSQNDLFYSVQKTGTWMHRVLALKFAAWLSPEFELWVFSTIEKILFGNHVERERSFERTIQLQKEMGELKEKIEKTGEDFERYIEIERELKREKSIRKALTNVTVSEMKDLFE